MVTPRRTRLDGNFFASLLIDRPHRKLDLAAIVEANDLHFDLIAHGHNIADFADALLRQFRDVHQAILAAQEIHKGPEVHQLDDLTVVNLTYFGLGNNVGNPVNGALTRIRIDGRDLNCPVVLDIDLGTGNFADFTIYNCNVM